MQSLDQHLLALLSERKISYEDAIGKSSNPRDFEQRAARFRTAPAR
jgi:Tfp pilus assembly ATPase PilU